MLQPLLLLQVAELSHLQQLMQAAASHLQVGWQLPLHLLLQGPWPAAQMVRKYGKAAVGARGGR